MAYHRKVYVFLKRTFSQPISTKHLLCASAKGGTGEQVIKKNCVLEELVWETTPSVRKGEIIYSCWEVKISREESQCCPAPWPGKGDLHRLALPRFCIYIYLLSYRPHYRQEGEASLCPRIDLQFKGRTGLTCQPAHVRWVWTGYSHPFTHRDLDIDDDKKPLFPPRQKC